jgi:dinuclear metal center YbgI/SA1388 family protein
MTFKELYDNLSNKYPNALKCEWDNDGIMCASDLTTEVKNVLIALDVTMDTVNYAIKNGFDTIISHHPLVFRSQRSLTPLNFTQNKLINLIKNDINVMSFHTRLDATSPGVNDVLASLLGLEGVVEDTSEKIGRVGTYSSEISLEEFAQIVKKALSSPFVLFNGNKPVKKVYVVGGDGKDLIENAINYGADTIITGRASYNTTIDANDMGINIVEAGHFYTENPVCKQIEKDILSICPSIKTEIFYSNSIKVI